jgi:hypothetical protein
MLEKWDIVWEKKEKYILSHCSTASIENKRRSH